MRKLLRLALWALGVLAFFLLVPALVDKPVQGPPSSEEKPAAAAFFSALGVPEQQGGSQASAIRMDRPERPVLSCSQPAALPNVTADANGHPIGAKTYIEAVYQAFRLEDKSG